MSCRDVVREPRRVFQHLLPARPSPERCVEDPVPRASPSGNCAGVSWPRMGMSRSARGTQAECPSTAFSVSNRPFAVIRTGILHRLTH
jgi:hypothetical protein